MVPPSGLSLTTHVSMTVHRLFGGSISGGFAPGIVLDNEFARDRAGNLAQAGDLLISGTYFWSVGKNFSAIELRGRWTNVIADAVRHEQHFVDDLAAERASKPGPGSSTPFIRLAGCEGIGGSKLKHFRIHSFSDGDEASPIVAGSGSLLAGTIIGHPSINLTGNTSSMRQVELRSNEKLSLLVGGDVTDCSVRVGDAVPPVIDVGGTMSLDDGKGGLLLFSRSVAPGQRQSYVVGRSGLLSVAFGPEMLLLQCVVLAGKSSGCTQVSGHGASGAGGLLAWSCGTESATDSCVISAQAADDGNDAAQQSSETFEVRQVAGVGNAV